MLHVGQQDAQSWCILSFCHQPLRFPQNCTSALGPHTHWHDVMFIRLTLHEKQISQIRETETENSE